MTQTLLLIDLQNDYFPGGAMELDGGLAAVEQAQKLLLTFRQKGWPVIHIQHISIRAGATFFLPETKGVQIHHTVSPEKGELVFQKHYPNSFRDTPLLSCLREQSLNRLVIAGMMTHMCIDTTVRAAADYGFSCLVAHDACATRALSFQGNVIPAGQVHRAFMATLDGLFARVQSVDEICSLL